MAARKKKASRARARSDARGRMRSLIGSSAFEAVHDRSYRYIDEIAEEMMRDPKIGPKLQYHARQFLKTLLEAM